MDCFVDIYNLSAQFYTDYPTDQYPEIAVKAARPYSCLRIELMDDLYVCVPFRSHVHHKYAYHFKHSKRSQKDSSGLDYTKAVLIQDEHYLDTTTPAIIDQDEYKETMQNLPRIIQDVRNFVGDYKEWVNGRGNLHPKEWARRYGMSSLQYFNDLLIDPLAVENETSRPSKDNDK